MAESVYARAACGNGWQVGRVRLHHTNNGRYGIFDIFL